MANTLKIKRTRLSSFNVETIRGRLKKLAVSSFFLFFVTHAFSQVPDFSKVPTMWDADSANITDLVHHGVKIEKKKAICWFPRDSLTVQRMNEIADTINMGIIAAEKLIGAPLPWQVHRFNEPYIFYFRLDSFVSHASGAGFVSIPFWRIKNQKAPWLHEAMHEMLNTTNGDWDDTTITTEENSKKNMPLWLLEGLPDYVSVEVSRINHLQWYDVLSRSSRMNIDSIFIQELKRPTDTTSYILSYVGEKGLLPELFTKDRGLYAPAFYHASGSFVHFIAENYGLDTLLAAISSFQKENETIEKLTGKPLAVLKQQWLQKLGINN